MRPKTENLIDELRQWCDVERGRRSEVSRILNITRQAKLKTDLIRTLVTWQLINVAMVFGTYALIVGLYLRY